MRCGKGPGRAGLVCGILAAALGMAAPLPRGAAGGEPIVIRNPVIVPAGSPEFVVPPTPCGQEFAVEVGQTLRFAVRASDPDPAQTVTLSFTMEPAPAPPGPFFDPVPPPANPVQTDFVWTPTQQDAQIGEFRVVLVATDSTGLRAKCKVILTVPLGPQPFVLREKLVVDVAVETYTVQGGPEQPNGGLARLRLHDAITGTGRGRFFLGPITTPLPGPGIVVGLTKTVEITEADAVTDGVLFEGVVEKVVSFQVSGEPTPREIPVSIDFAGFISVPGAQPGERVRVTDARVVFETEEVIPPP